MIPIIVIRPQPGCDATVAAAWAQALDARGFPLFIVKPVAWEPPPAESVDALLIGSANALRHGGPGLAAYNGKPAYAVGAATAEAGRIAGLDIVATSNGSLQAVLDDLRTGHRRLLRLAGRERVELSPPPGVTIVERTVYASKPQPLPGALRNLLAKPAVVLLHSAEAARHFAYLCERGGVTRAHLSLAAIGPRVAEAAGQGWRAVAAAASPDDAALLALAREMCQEPAGSVEMARQGLMQDGAQTSEGPATDAPPPPQAPPPPPVRRSGRGALTAALLAFLLGGGVAGWLVWHGELDDILPDRGRDRVAASQDEGGFATEPTAQPQGASSDAIDSDQVAVGLGTVEARLAMLEDRFARIGLQADAAGANASRAEALLIALAARRRLERGEPLGYLEDQLKLRFGGAQPQAVQTIIAAARQPVTLSMLSSQLAAAAPTLAGTRQNESNWNKISREFSSLFVVRRTSSSSKKPLDRIERAQVLLKAGRIEDAIAEVERLPGAQDAQEWIALARRYHTAQRALDVIETAAMLQPRQLRDETGNEVKKPSPLAPPAEEVDPRA